MTFGEIVEYLGEHHAVFAGREIGSYTVAEGPSTALLICVSRYFRYEDGRWRQYHHHGSIDDAIALGSYQEALAT